MKDFLKYVGATVTGLILFGLVICILGVMSIVAPFKGEIIGINPFKNNISP